MKTVLTILSFLTLTMSIALSPRADHSIWNKLLTENVSPAGKVNYKNFKINKNSVSKYLQELKNHTPGTDWTDEETMAYYINMYNAYTVQFIITKYPVSSPKDVKYSGKDIWELKLVKMGNKTMSLSDVENILKGYRDGRIHFAINCGAVSCPRLMNKAWEAKTLDADLTRMTKIFINDLSSNIIKEKKIKISKIFEWYSLDFKSSKTKFEGIVSSPNKGSSIPQSLVFNWVLFLYLI